MNGNLPQSTDASVLWALLEEASEGVWHWDVEADEVRWSSSLKTLLGRDPAPATFEAIEQITHPDDRDRLERAIEHHLRTRDLYSVEVRLQKGDGEYVGVLARGTSVVDDRGEVVEMIGFLVDQSDRMQAELKLQRSLQRFRSFMDHCPAAVFIKNPDRTYTYVNAAAARLAGTTPSIMQRSVDTEIFPAETAAELNRVDREVLETGKVSVWTGDIERADGSVRWVQDTKFPVDLEDGRRAVGGFGVDLTDLRDAQIVVEARQRLESLGRLSGGVAHEFNNMLGVILGHAHMARDLVDAEGELDEHVREIIAAAERSAKVVGQLLTFARQAPSHVSVIDAGGAIRDLGTVLGTLIGEDVSLTLDLEDRPAPVLIDKAQFDQVLTNLCVNARDAVGGRGSIVVESSIVWIDEPDGVEGETAPGEYVRVSVRDDGAGMDADVQARAFEPFYTTKPAGKGTGLGLATVYGIVKRAGGWIEIDSVPGEGTDVHFLLPCSANVPGPSASGTADPRHPPLELADATVLVVEDEPALLRLVTRLLERLGCTVLAAPSPARALELSRELDRLDILVSDVMMPEMNGPELARRLIESRPDLRALFMSGYRPGDLDESGQGLAEVEVLEKPFTMAELAAALERVIRA